MASLADYPHIISIMGLNAIAWTFALIAISLTIGRFVVRWRKSRRFYIDDCFSAVAASLLIPFFVASLITLHVGYNAQLFVLGLREDPPSVDDVRYATRVELATPLLFWLIVYAVKASFLGLYWRVYVGTRKSRVAWIALAIFTALSFGATFMSVFWECGSPSKLGNLQACNNLAESFAVRMLSLWCSLNIIDCILLMAFPISMTKRGAFLPRIHRVGLVVIFALTLFFIALDILRTVWYVDTTLHTITNLVAVWIVLEPSFAVIICTLPTYGNLLPCEDHAAPLGGNRASNGFVRQLSSESLELGRISKRDAT